MLTVNNFEHARCASSQMLLVTAFSLEGKVDSIQIVGSELIPVSRQSSVQVVVCSYLLLELQLFLSHSGLMRLGHTKLYCIDGRRLTETGNYMDEHFGQMFTHIFLFQTVIVTWFIILYRLDKNTTCIETARTSEIHRKPVVVQNLYHCE